MRPILISGGNKKTRENRIKEILSKLGVGLNDIYQVFPDKSIGIEEVKRLCGWAFLKSFGSPKKAGILYEANLLTFEAGNSLLKILEEPPKTCVFILETDNFEKILPTILSRCKIISLPFIANENEKDNIDDLIIILSGTPGEKFKMAEERSKDKTVISSWINNLIRTARNILLFLITSEKKLKNESTEKLIKELERRGIVTDRTINDLVIIIKELIRVRVLVEKNVNLRLILENFCLKTIRFSD